MESAPQYRWDTRLPAESTKAFEFFQFYLGLGPSHRSHEAVARHFGRTRQAAGSYSARYHWVERAACYDKHLAEQDQRILLEQRAAAYRTRCQREVARRDKIWALAQKLRDRIEELLRVPVTKPAPGSAGDAVVPVNVGVVQPLVTLTRQYDALMRSAVEDLVGEEPKTGAVEQQAEKLLIAGAFSLWSGEEDPASNGVSSESRQDHLGAIEAAAGTVPATVNAMPPAGAGFHASVCDAA